MLAKERKYRQPSAKLMEQYASQLLKPNQPTSILCYNRKIIVSLSFEIVSIVLFPNIAFPSMTRRNTARSDTNNIAHAILIALVAILHARVRALETVVPCRDARKKPNTQN
jgi:hypothetical protein